MSNLGFIKFMESQGIRTEKTAVGDRYVLENMRENGYAIGGEQSGHVILLHHTTTGDGELTAGKLLKLLAKSGKKMSELNGIYAQYPQVLVNVAANAAQKAAYKEDKVLADFIGNEQQKLMDMGRVLVRVSARSRRSASWWRARTSRPSTCAPSASWIRSTSGSSKVKIEIKSRKEDAYAPCRYMERLRAAGCHRRQPLERWGETLLVRPDPQVVWKTPQQSSLWAKADAVYHRSNQGGGEWEYRRRLPEKWKITCGEGEDKLTLIVSPTGFKHTGVFPEQAVNWAWYAKKIRAAGRPIKVLNLFGYTGGATLACAAAGATVCHVDASKGIVAWGKDNAAASGLADRPIRWLVDDCAKFVAREKRRGNTYDGIIMDPPSYGRGPGGEIWKLEDCIYDLISQCEEVLSDKPLFFAVNSYTTGLSPAVMEYMLKTTLIPRFGGKTSCDEIGLPVSATGGVVPCGATAIWEE